MIINLSPSRQAELEQFAERHGQTFTDALDDAIATYLDLQGQHFDEDVAAVQEAIEELHAGRSVSIEEFDASMRRRYGISR